MDTLYKRVKYTFIQSCLIPLRKRLLGNKRNNTRTLFSGNPVLFIMGSGRNGSTLLALLLRRHPEIYLPPEQYVLPYAIMSWHLNIFQSWKSFCTQTIRSFSSKNQHWKLHYEDFSEVESELLNIEKEYRNLPNIFEAVFRHYAKARVGERNIIGDHSPNVTLFYKTVFREFPNAKYVFLVRNPLDVIMSYRKMPGNPASRAEFAAWKWNNSIRAFDFIRKINEGNVILFKYEDLVSDPQSITRKLQEFLGIPVRDITRPKTVESEVDPLGASGMKHHKHLYQPISKRSVDRWIGEMDDATYTKVLPLVKKNAKRFGYDLEREQGVAHEIIPTEKN